MDMLEGNVNNMTHNYNYMNPTALMRRKKSNISTINMNTLTLI